MKKKKTFTYLGTHLIGKTCVAIEAIKCGLSNVTESVCDNCKPVTGFYLGKTCPKCNRPFRSIKQTVR